MKRAAIICTVMLVCGGSTQADAAESIQTVKALYAAAAYEDALAALNSADVEGRPAELQQYRVFCLVALGRQTEAEKAMEALIAADPLYVFDPVETSPRVQEAFNQRRQQLLPELAKQFYFEARGALDRKERTNAIARFERLVTIIDAAQGASPALTEMRVLATGFLDLSRALPEPAPAPAPVAQPPALNTAAAAAVPPPRRSSAACTRPTTARCCAPHATGCTSPHDETTCRSAWTSRSR